MKVFYFHLFHFVAENLLKVIKNLFRLKKKSLRRQVTG